MCITLHIQNTCNMPPVTNSLTMIFEDNVTYVAQVRGGYIKEDNIKHIS